MVLSVEAKKNSAGVGWEVLTDGGRERSGKQVVEWVEEAVSLGAGEILLTSIDREGTRKGFDTELTKVVASAVSVPVIASGGMGSTRDLISAVTEGGVDAIAMADILHYQRAVIDDVRETAVSAGFQVR